MRQAYTPEQIEYLRQGYQRMQIPELTSAFNSRFGLAKSATAIKSALSNRRITCGRPGGNRPGCSLLFSEEQVEFIINHYPAMGRRRLTDTLNCKFNTRFKLSQIVAFVNNHGILSGRSGRFEPGEAPWNAGTKGLVKPNSGSFQKGNVPASIRPLGHERICSKDGYILIKVAEPNPHTGAPTRYRAKHQVVWERTHGPVPSGYCITFRDGDKLNCDINNLIAVSRQELLYLNRNGYAELQPEIRPVMRSLAKAEVKRFGLLKTIGENE